MGGGVQGVIGQCRGLAGVSLAAGEGGSNRGVCMCVQLRPRSGAGEVDHVPSSPPWSPRLPVRPSKETPSPHPRTPGAGDGHSEAGLRPGGAAASPARPSSGSAGPALLLYVLHPAGVSGRRPSPAALRPAQPGNRLLQPEHKQGCEVGRRQRCPGSACAGPTGTATRSSTRGAAPPGTGDFGAGASPSPGRFNPTPETTCYKISTALTRDQEKNRTDGRNTCRPRPDSSHPSCLHCLEAGLRRTVGNKLEIPSD